MASRAQTINVTCPSCKQPFVTDIHQIIDVGEEPALKWKLLSGQLNVATCSHCGMAGILGMPFAYHDPDKELLYVFVPGESGLMADDQQKLIGALTQDVMNSLPAEKRKAYLFSPQTFILLDSLINAILKADGITQEMIEAQQKRSKLVNELLQAKDDDEKLKELVESHSHEIDYEFFQTLTAMAGAAAEEENQELATALIGLRARLLKLQSPAAPPDAQPQIDPVDGTMTREELLQQLRDTEDDEQFEYLVAVGRPIIDYAFYVHIANLIEAAEKESRQDEAKSLTALRDRVLDLTARLDKEVQESLNEANELLVQFVQADDPAAAIREQIDRLSDMFFYVLTANIEHLSKEEGEEKANMVARLQEIARLAGDALEERMPAPLKLVNRLLRTEQADAQAELLDREASHVNQEMIDIIDALIAQFEPADRTPMVEQLTAIREMVVARISDAPANADEQG